MRHAKFGVIQQLIILRREDEISILLIFAGNNPGASDGAQIGEKNFPVAREADRYAAVCRADPDLPVIAAERD